MRRAAKLARILTSRLWTKALISTGTAAAVEHCTYLEHRSYKTIVDIGANRGQFALAARRCIPEATIIAFEPLGGPARTMKRNFARDPRFFLHQAAIGNQSGRMLMHVARRDDSSSLLPIGAQQQRLFPGTDEIRTESVQIEPLGHFLDAAAIVPPALLKLDVQGFELRALRGSEAVLHRFESVCSEVSYVELYEGQALAEAVTTWLEAHGFSVAGVYNTTYDRDGHRVQADLLFERTGVDVH